MAEGGRFAAIVAGAVVVVFATAAAGMQVVDETSGKVRQAERRVYSAGVEKIRANVSGEIEIVGTEDAAVMVEAGLAGRVRVPTMDADLRDGTLYLSIDCTFLWDCDAALELAVPEGIPVNARTSSGNVRAIGLTGLARLSTGSGNVVVEGADEEVTLSTASGSIRASDLRSSTADVRTASGDVRIDFVAPPDQVNVDTASGNVRIGLPSGEVAYNVEGETGSGDRRIDVRTDPTSQHLIRASTASGSVIVEYTRSTEAGVPGD